MIVKSTSGVGFPSTNRALARIPRNLKDPHGYYLELGVEPWATTEEIRVALRRAYRLYHSDGTAPDVRKFMRIKRIGEVLLDPVTRAAYDRTPDGERLLDVVYEMELEDMSAMELELLKQSIKPKPAEVFWDFFADAKDPRDKSLAQDWYRHLIDAAPAAGYTGPIKVLVTNEDDPKFMPDSRILGIPRHWVPSLTVAFALLRLYSPACR